MNSEKLVLDMYRKHQYESTQHKIQWVVMIFTATGMIVATVLTAVLVSEPVSVCSSAGALVCIAIAFLLQQWKWISPNSASLIYFIYLCFIFMPVNWYVTDGLSGSTPYVSIIVMLAVVIIFSAKTQKIMLILYSTVLIALTILSIIIEPVASQIPGLIYKSVAFIITILLVVYYMLIVFGKYDQMNDQFLHESIKDGLTQVFRRGVFDVIITYAESKFQSAKTDYVIIMIDVDRLKKINDEYGHITGDFVLRNTALYIKQNMRKEDFVIRYGGDEFLVVLMDISIENASNLLDKADQEQPCRSLMGFQISVSRGYARRSECDTSDEVIHLADQRMYANKLKSQT